MVELVHSKRLDALPSHLETRRSCPAFRKKLKSRQASEQEAAELVVNDLQFGMGAILSRLDKKGKPYHPQLQHPTRALNSRRPWSCRITSCLKVHASGYILRVDISSSTWQSSPS